MYEMGCRTHIGILRKDRKVEYVYGHFKSPLHRGGADILRGELSEGYEHCGRKPYQAFEPDLFIEVAYLRNPQRWVFKPNSGIWQPLTLGAILDDLQEKISRCQHRGDTYGAAYYQEELERGRAIKISPLVDFPSDLPKFPN